jgi:hypothetical protein
VASLCAQRGSLPVDTLAKTQLAKWFGAAAKWLCCCEAWRNWQTRWTQNPSLHHLTSCCLSCMCEGLRPTTTISDTHNVNMASTARRPGSQRLLRARESQAGVTFVMVLRARVRPLLLLSPGGTFRTVCTRAYGSKQASPCQGLSRNSPRKREAAETA